MLQTQQPLFYWNNNCSH